MELINILNCGIFPQNLKIAKIIPVYKSGKQTDVRNYIPISLLSILSTILEKIKIKQGL